MSKSKNITPHERFNYIKNYFSQKTYTSPQVFKMNDIINDNTILEGDELHNSSNLNVKIVDQDCLDTAIEYITLNIKPLVLNLANGISPCHDSYWGNTQEEWIFRNSNAFQTHERKHYPICYENKIIYSPDLIILKKYDNVRNIKNCNNMNNNNDTINVIDMIDNLNEKEYLCSMITTDAICDPDLTRNPNNKNEKQYLYEKDLKLMDKKIESIFKIAILKNHKTLILGAFGCGVFNNPPVVVANLFKKYIQKYKNYFDNIIFSILIISERDKNVFETFNKIINVDYS